MTITAFEPSNLKAIRADIDAALKGVADKHGIELRAGTMRYDIGSFSVTLNATIAAVKADQEMADARQWAAILGVDISQPSTHPHRTGAVITGFDSKKRSKPWRFTWNGKPYITDNAGVKVMFPAKTTGAPTAVEAHDLIGREVPPPTGLKA